MVWIRRFVRTAIGRPPGHKEIVDFGPLRILEVEESGPPEPTLGLSIPSINILNRRSLTVEARFRSPGCWDL